MLGWSLTGKRMQHAICLTELSIVFSSNAAFVSSSSRGVLLIPSDQSVSGNSLMCAWRMLNIGTKQAMLAGDKIGVFMQHWVIHQVTKALDRSLDKSIRNSDSTFGKASNTRESYMSFYFDSCIVSSRSLRYETHG